MLINVAVQPSNRHLPPLRGAVVWPDIPIATRKLATKALDQWQAGQKHLLPPGCRFDRSDLWVMSPDRTRVTEVTRTLTIVEATPAIAA